MDIKAIINNAVSSIDNMAKTAVNKTSEVATSAKHSILLKTEEAKLEELFKTLGKLFYEQAKGVDLRAQITAEVIEIDEQKLVIRELQTKISEKNKKNFCSVCGKQMRADSIYCKVCGTKQDLKRKKAEEAIKTPHKPLSSEEFVEFFKNTTKKYFS